MTTHTMLVCGFVYHARDKCNREKKKTRQSFGSIAYVPCGYSLTVLIICFSILKVGPVHLASLQCLFLLHVVVIYLSQANKISNLSTSILEAIVLCCNAIQHSVQFGIALKNSTGTGVARGYRKALGRWFGPFYGCLGCVKTPYESRSKFSLTFDDVL